MVAIRCSILHAVSSSPLSVEFLEDGVLLVDDGLVKDIGEASRFEREGFDLDQCEHYPGHLLLPGFIDTHVHSPQIDVIASYGEQLLDWLHKYTFPAEAKYADAAYAEKSAGEFADGLLAAGTTSALVYVTSHRQATDAMFQAAHERNMRLVAGKVLMDQQAIPAVQDTPESGYADSETLIRSWHGKGRLGYAITPRFAASCTAEQLEGAGRLHADYPDTWIQTHLSENHDEIALVQKLHPESSDYLNVYERHGLVNDRAFFGHCLHLSDSEVQRMADAGARVAFCPSSNLFLGSGLLDLARLKTAGVPVSVASDVGGGTGLSMLRTLGDAYKVCQMRGYSLSAMEAFAMVTLGNAEAMQLDGVIGNLLPGKEADFVLLDGGSNNILRRRLRLAESIEEIFFIYMMLADEQVVAETWIAGQKQYQRDREN